MKKRRLGLLLAIAATTLLALSASASADATSGLLIVDPGSLGGHCSDSYPVPVVSLTTPWCTMAHAVATAPSGSVVQLRGGVYPTQTLNAVGSRSDYVTLEPYGWGTSAQEPVTIAGISLEHESYLRFQGFHLTGSDASASSFTPAVFTDIGVSHVQFIDNTVTGEGFDMANTPSDVLIQGNAISGLLSNCGVHSQADGSGVYGGGPAMQVIDNSFQQVPNAAMSFGNVTNLLVSGNHVTTIAQGSSFCGRHVDIIELDNHAMGPVDIVDNTFSGSQFVLRNATGLTVQNNLMVHVDGWMELVADPGAQILNNTWAEGNTVCTGCGSLLMTDYGLTSSFRRAPFNYTNQMNGTVVENNIMHTMGIQSVPASQYHEDYDIITNLKKTASSGIQGRHTQFATPSYVDASSANFHLVPGSVGWAAGDPSRALASDMLGWTWSGAPNIGALQQAAPPAPGASAPARPAQPVFTVRTITGADSGRLFRMVLRCSVSCRLAITGSVERAVVRRTHTTRHGHRKTVRKVRYVRVTRLRTAKASLEPGVWKLVQLRTPAAYGGVASGRRERIVVQIVARSAAGTVTKKLTFTVTVRRGGHRARRR